jgi:hypothetical protein
VNQWTDLLNQFWSTLALFGAWISDQEWLTGILVGLVLVGLFGWIRGIIKVRRIKSAIRHELRANQAQISQKQAMVTQMITAFEQESYQPVLSIPPLTTVFDHYYPTVVHTYSALARDNLHVIYALLRQNDDFLNNFQPRLMGEVTSKINARSHAAHIAQLHAINESYQIIAGLINDFLRGKPHDVFARRLVGSSQSNQVSQSAPVSQAHQTRQPSQTHQATPTDQSAQADQPSQSPKPPPAKSRKRDPYSLIP